MPTGRCHCGGVHYDMPAETIYKALCHCSDCRRHSGAPFVAWGLIRRDQLKVEGEIKEYASSENARRHFCPNCGTALFYTNEVVFPGQIDVQLATLDEPDKIVPDTQVQRADRIRWIDRIDQMAQFDRYPG